MNFESFNLDTSNKNDLEIIQSNETLRENDLIIPESDIERAKALLKEYGINFEENKYKEKQELDEKSWVEAEFILSIKNNNNEASFEDTIKIFEFLKKNNIIIRYGHKPTL